MERRLGGFAIIATVVSLALLLPVSAVGKKKERKLGAATYAGMTTFNCRTDAIPIHPGQNLNDFALTKTCPNAERVRGPVEESVFADGSDESGYITRFKPSMVEIKPNGRLVTPSVWDLHLHHVVWVRGLNPTFASGEEKTHVKLPQGYGLKVAGDANWIINQMIHNLGARDGRSVYITWQIDWVPETGERTDIAEADVRWLDVAGAPQIYPVFDAERDFDLNGDGKYVFPDEVPTDPGLPGYEERGKISNARKWTVPEGGATLVFGAGHLHPGGKTVDLFATRDGRTVRLFRSKARYYEPAGAVSWDVSMTATRRSWRVSLQAGDVVSINTTYDVRRASWYESMGIMPLAWSKADDPKALDPFTQRKAFRRVYRRGGILTHGRLKENIDTKARKNLRLADPRELKAKGRVPKDGINIRSFNYLTGGFTATRGFPSRLMRPPAIRAGGTVTFNNLDALPSMPQTEQAWHSITSCRAPCNRDSGIGYPLANGPVAFDSGQLGYGTGTSSEVTTGTGSFTTPPLPARKPPKGKGKRSKRRGTTYTYFCRIHPDMRGSIRVRGT